LSIVQPVHFGLPPPLQTPLKQSANVAQVCMFMQVAPQGPPQSWSVSPPSV